MSGPVDARIAISKYTVTSGTKIMTKYVANVNGIDGKAVVVEANSQQEASQQVNEKYGKSNVITQPEPAQSQAQIDSIKYRLGD